MSMNSILNNSVNLPMMEPCAITSSATTSSPFNHDQHTTQRSKDKSYLKKAMSTPSIFEKIKLEESDNVFYDSNEHEYSNLNVLAKHLFLYLSNFLKIFVD